MSSRRTFLKRAGGLIAAAAIPLFIPSERLDLGVPKTNLALASETARFVTGRLTTRVCFPLGTSDDPVGVSENFSVFDIPVVVDDRLPSDTISILSDPRFEAAMRRQLPSDDPYRTYSEGPPMTKQEIMGEILLGDARARVRYTASIQRVQESNFQIQVSQNGVFWRNLNEVDGGMPYDARYIRVQKVVGSSTSSTSFTSFSVQFSDGSIKESPHTS